MDGFKIMPFDCGKYYFGVEICGLYSLLSLVNEKFQYSINICDLFLLRYSLKELVGVS